MTDDRRRLAISLLLVGALPLLVSQLLPSWNPDRWSPIAVALLIAGGTLAGWTFPSVRAWAATVAWVVVGAALIMASWTDLLLNVSPSIDPVETWRAEAFIAIVAGAGLATIGFTAGALLRRRGAIGSFQWSAAVTAAVTVVLVIVGAGLTAEVFSRTPLVVQADQDVVTVFIDDEGLTVDPPVIEARTYRLIYESRASRSVIVTEIEPLGSGDGRPRAVTSAEIELWLAGTWEALGPQFPSGVSFRTYAPGQRVDGGEFTRVPSTDGTGGAFWYLSTSDVLRPWPGESGEEMRTEAPWPVDHHVVVPVTGS